MVVTRLEVLKPIEPGTSSVVLAVSMKTPHRSLRSNEIELQSNGLLDIPLELTFSLQVFFHSLFMFISWPVLHHSAVSTLPEARW